MGEQELILGVDELGTIVLECRKCGCRVNFAAERDYSEDMRCPGCSDEWRRAAIVLRRYNSFFQEALKLNATEDAPRVRLRMVLPS